MLLQAAQNKDLSKVRQALEKGENINQWGEQGKTALIFACESSPGSSPDHNLIQFLIEKGAEVNAKSPIKGFTPLTAACDAGDLDTVKILLKAGADPNLKGELGYTPLMCASSSFKVSKDSLDICKLLVAHSADIDARNEDGEGVLENLILSNETKAPEEILAFLISEAFKKNPKRDFSGLAKLVINYGPLSALKLLVESGLNIDGKDQYGNSLLYEACSIHQVEKAGFLLKAGANYNYGPKFGGNDHVFDLACRFGRIDFLDFLKQDGFNFRKEPDLLKTAINSAVENEQWKVIDYLKANEIDLNMPFDGHKTPLMTSIEFNKHGMFTFLLESGANIHERDSRKNTALLFAAYYGRLPMLKALLTAGADLNESNNLNWNALMQASIKGFPDVIQYLTEAGIELNRTDAETGATPLIIAAAEGNVAGVKILLDSGADHSIVAKNGRTATTWAKGKGRQEILRLFGEIKPHFSPFVSKDDRIHCSFCEIPLTEEMITNNYCRECEAHYCDQHYPWTDWKSSDPTDTYPSRNVICPNGHFNIQ